MRTVQWHHAIRTEQEGGMSKLVPVLGAGPWDHLLLPSLRPLLVLHSERHPAPAMLALRSTPKYNGAREKGAALVHRPQPCSL